MDVDLHCNNLSCRKTLNLESHAITTTCSHIFCRDCAEDFFATSRLCPACETSLSEQDDIVLIDLHPNTSYKSTVLAGLPPAVIVDIASRALNFWTYQVSQESAYQTLQVKSLQDRVNVLEKQCASIVREANNEISTLKQKLGTAERELDLEKRKLRESQEAQKEAQREYTKIKGQLDKVKQRTLVGQPLNNLPSSTPKQRPLMTTNMASTSRPQNFVAKPQLYPTSQRRDAAPRPSDPLSFGNSNRSREASVVSSRRSPQGRGGGMLFGNPALAGQRVGALQELANAQNRRNRTT